MISKIWKYPLKPGENEIELPYWAKLVHTGCDPSGKPCAWFTVSTPDGERTIVRELNLIATGQEFDGEKWRYHSTIHHYDPPLFGFVWHVLTRIV